MNDLRTCADELQSALGKASEYDQAEENARLREALNEVAARLNIGEWLQAREIVRSVLAESPAPLKGEPNVQR